MKSKVVIGLVVAILCVGVAVVAKRALTPPPALKTSQPEKGIVLPTSSSDRLALLLEICDAHSPLRDYAKGLRVDSRTIPILLQIADHDPKTVQDAVLRFESWPTKDAGAFGKDDVTRMLASIIWKPNDLVKTGYTQANWLWPVAEGKREKLEVAGENPGDRSGVWLGFDYYRPMVKYGSLVARDLRPFHAQMLPPNQIDAAIKSAFANAPESTHKQFGLTRRL